VFDVIKIATEATKRRATTFSGIVKTFFDSANAIILSEMQRFRQTSPAKFISGYVGKEVFTILFIGIEGDTIRMHKQIYSCFVKGDSTGISMTWKNCPPSCNDDGYVEFLSGTQALRDSASLKKLLVLGPIYTINALIGVDAILSPEIIAGPIDILLFTHHPPLWLQKKTECY
jgi:hypothetical protein